MSTLFLDSSMSIQDAINKLNPNEAHTLFLSPGIYKEKLFIEHSHLTFIGVSAYNTVIVFDDFSYKIHEDGLLFNTFRTSTVTVTGNHNTFINITIENNSGHGPKIGQAIALSLYGNENVLKACRLKGNQDTLFIGPLPTDLSIRYAHILPLSMRHQLIHTQYISETTIIGNIDFIFGSGNALFKNCLITFNDDGYLAAPSTFKDQLGLVFKDCLINSTSSDLSIILARPWREYGRVSFIDCKFDLPIEPRRYDTWDKTHFYFYETPYVSNPLSQELPDDLKSIIDENLNKF